MQQKQKYETRQTALFRCANTTGACILARSSKAWLKWDDSMTIAHQHQQKTNNQKIAPNDTHTQSGRQTFQIRFRQHKHWIHLNVLECSSSSSGIHQHQKYQYHHQQQQEHQHFLFLFSIHPHIGSIDSTENSTLFSSPSSGVFLFSSTTISTYHLALYIISSDEAHPLIRLRVCLEASSFFIQCHTDRKSQRSLKGHHQKR